MKVFSEQIALCWSLLNIYEIVRYIACGLGFYYLLHTWTAVALFLEADIIGFSICEMLTKRSVWSCYS